MTLFFRIMFTGLLAFAPQDVTWKGCSPESDASRVSVLFVSGDTADSVHRPALIYPIDALAGGVDQPDDLRSFTDPDGRTWGAWPLTGKVIALEGAGGDVSLDVAGIPCLSDLVSDGRVQASRLTDLDCAATGPVVGRIELGGGSLYTRDVDRSLQPIRFNNCGDCSCTGRPDCREQYALRAWWGMQFDPGKEDLLVFVNSIEPSERLTLRSFSQLGVEREALTVSVSNLPADEELAHFAHLYRLLATTPQHRPTPVFDTEDFGAGSSGCMGGLVTEIGR